MASHASLLWCCSHGVFWTSLTLPNGFLWLCRGCKQQCSVLPFCMCICVCICVWMFTVLWVHVCVHLCMCMYICRAHTHLGCLPHSVSTLFIEIGWLAYSSRETRVSCLSPLTGVTVGHHACQACSCVRRNWTQGLVLTSQALHLSHHPRLVNMLYLKTKATLNTAEALVFHLSLKGKHDNPEIWTMSLTRLVINDTISHYYALNDCRWSS